MTEQEKVFIAEIRGCINTANDILFSGLITEKTLTEIESINSSSNLLKHSLLFCQGVIDEICKEFDILNADKQKNKDDAYYDI